MQGGVLLPVLTLRPYEGLCGRGGASSPHCLGGPLLAFKTPMEAPGSKPSQEPSPPCQALGRRKSVVSEGWGGCSDQAQDQAVLLRDLIGLLGASCAGQKLDGRIRLGVRQM